MIKGRRCNNGHKISLRYLIGGGFRLISIGDASVGSVDPVWDSEAPQTVNNKPMKDHGHHVAKRCTCDKPKPDYNDWEPYGIGLWTPSDWSNDCAVPRYRSRTRVHRTRALWLLVFDFKDQRIAKPASMPYVPRRRKEAHIWRIVRSEAKHKHLMPRVRLRLAKISI